MFQSKPVPSPSFTDRVRTPAGRRALGIGLALLIEGLMLLLLLTMGPSEPQGTKSARPTVVTFQTEEVAEESPEPPAEEPQEEQRQPASPQPQTEPPRPQPATPSPIAPPPSVLPPLPQVPPAAAAPRPPSPPAPPARPNRPVYGPVDRRSPAMQDSQRVGTAPNGEPLYAAEWYREPSDRMLRDYLSTARGPGWGLIACRTAPDFRVEDCVGLSEYPEGSQITRAVLAAAWEFRVRPPRLGGNPLVGAWVRIRIDYGIDRR